MIEMMLNKSVAGDILLAEDSAMKALSAFQKSEAVKSSWTTTKAVEKFLERFNEGKEKKSVVKEILLQ